jgi:peptidyl-prolyl cis-trans isomerase A (cyclophilin A)
MRQLIALLVSVCFTLAVHAAPPQVELKTSMGTITVELYPEKAPKTVENFLQYVKDDFYVNSIFHRVVSGFVVQGGGLTADMKQKVTRSPILNEANNGLKNDVGTLAMARTSAPHSATSQFFINLKANDFLNFPGTDGWGYAVFGKVIAGMEVVEKIAKVATGNVGGYQNVPSTPIVIESVRLLPETPADQSDCVFNWAERDFPQYFAPAKAASAYYQNYYYRYYATTGVYLATKDNVLWALGPPTNNALLSLGPISHFLQPAGCQ